MQVRFLATVLTLVMLTWSAPAGAHAMLIGSDPPEGAVLATAIRHITLKFMQPVSVLRLRLARPGNVVTDLPDARPDGDKLVIPTPADLKRGTYLLLWRVGGQDTHISAGILTFSLGKPGETPTVPLDHASGLDAGTWFIGLVLNMCLFVGVGGGLFGVWMADAGALPRPARRVMSGMLALVIAAAIPAAGMQGLEALDASWTALLSPDVWRASMATNFIYTVVLACLAAAVMLAAGRISTVSLARGLSLLALMSAAAAIATTGHTAASYPLWAVRLALFIHAASLIFWIGALVPLATLSLFDRAGLRTSLRRFSAVIPVAIAALLLSGILLARFQLRTPFDLIATSFGLVLCAKLAVVGLLLALAAYNRFVLNARCYADAPDARRSLASSAGIELLLVLAVVGAAGLWRFAPPPIPRGQMVAPIVAAIKGKEATAWVSLSAGFKRYRSMSISIAGKDGLPLAAKDVEMIATHTSGVAAPIRLAARNDGEGKWRIDHVYISLPGIWQFRFDIKIDEFNSVRLEDQLVLTR